MSYDIIGDIHGCYVELISLISKLGYQQDKGVFVHPQGRSLHLWVMLLIEDLNHLQS